MDPALATFGRRVDSDQGPSNRKLIPLFPAMLPFKAIGGRD